MIEEVRKVGCVLSGCHSVTEWRLLPEKINVLDLITALGAFGSFLAVIGAAIAILQSSKARNLSTVVEITRQLAAEREKAHNSKIYGMSDSEFHAFQMVHLVEQASMIVNHGWVSGQSKAFLLDWLRLEIPAMMQQPAYQAVIRDATGQQLCELFALRDRFSFDLKMEKHFERIYEQRQPSKR